MKQVKNDSVKTIAGKDYQVVVRGDTGEPADAQTPESDLKTRPARVKDLVTLLILNIPPQVMTRQDSIHAYRLYNQMETMKDDVMPIEDAEYAWLIAKLQHDAVGPKIFGVNCYVVEKTIKKAAGDEQPA